MKEGTKGEATSQKKEAKSELNIQESLFDRISRCMSKKMCELLDEDRCKAPEEKKEELYQKGRRDWEGQDNMQQFARKEKLEESDLPKIIHEQKEFNIPE